MPEDQPGSFVHPLPGQPIGTTKHRVPARRLPVPALRASRPGSCPEAASVAQPCKSPDRMTGDKTHKPARQGLRHPWLWWTGFCPRRQRCPGEQLITPAAKVSRDGLPARRSLGVRTCGLLPVRGLRSSPSFRTGRSPPATQPQLCQSGRPSLCMLVTGTGVLCLWWTPSGRLRPPPGIHVGNDTAPSRSRESGLASSSPEAWHGSLIPG